MIQGMQNILIENQIKYGHGSEVYNNKFKSFLKENDIEMYSTFNEGKSVVAERFIDFEK